MIQTILISCSLWLLWKEESWSPDDCTQILSNDILHLINQECFKEEWYFCVLWCFLKRIEYEKNMRRLMLVLFYNQKRRRLCHFTINLYHYRSFDEMIDDVTFLEVSFSFHCLYYYMISYWCYGFAIKMYSLTVSTSCCLGALTYCHKINFCQTWHVNLITNLCQVSHTLKCIAQSEITFKTFWHTNIHWI